jgi:hypothetical protein
MNLPKRNEWISWAIASMIILYDTKPEACKLDQKDLLSSFITFSRQLPVEDLVNTMNYYFLQTLNQQFKNQIVFDYNHHNNLNVDDTVSIDETLEIAAEIPLYEREMYIWSQKRLISRRKRIFYLISRKLNLKTGWRMYSRSLMIWSKFIKSVKDLLVIPTVEPYGAPIAPPIPFSIPEPQSVLEKEVIPQVVAPKKPKEEVVTVIDTRKELMIFRSVMDSVITGTNDILGMEVHTQINPELELKVMRSIFLTDPKDGSVMLNRAGKIIDRIAKGMAEITSPPDKSNN